VVFGSQAFVLSPLSLDRLAVRQLLDGIVPSIAGPATALGDAIALGVVKLRERPEGSRVMIVIADGDNNAGRFAPSEAATVARQNGVRVYVIGVGSKQASIPILEEGTVRYRDDLTMDEGALEEIAELTGGAYFRATDTRALEEISARIGQLEKTEAETRTAYLPQPLYRWPLGLALIALARSRSLPRRSQALRREDCRCLTAAFTSSNPSGFSASWPCSRSPTGSSAAPRVRPKARCTAMPIRTCCRT
jgi:Ca-activated chloride channel homolog